jgi:hypothetical protein
MREIGLVLVFGMAASVWAAPTGGVEAKTEQGRLIQIASWWQPAPAWQGRWWWREGSGSAWVRAGGFQMGPLIITSGGDGWRRWYPGTTLSSGYWGLAFDGGAWGAWAIQRPDTLEAGGQLGWSGGAFSTALGGDRTWSLEPPSVGTEPWSDRFRSGLTWDDGTWLAGVEATLLPASGGLGWIGKCHVSFDGGSWFGGVKAEEDRESGQESRWTASASAGWESWSVRWSRVQDRNARWEGRWADEARFWGVAWGAEAAVAYNGEWSPRGGVSASGRWERGHWRGSWSAASLSGLLVQTVTAGWEESLLEAEARWRLEGQSLGWFGPRSEMTLTVRRFF